MDHAKKSAKSARLTGHRCGRRFSTQSGTAKGKETAEWPKRHLKDEKTAWQS
jgi:hypothetical protein